MPECEGVIPCSAIDAGSRKVPSVMLTVSSPEPALTSPVLVRVETLILMVSFPSPPLMVLLIAETATNETPSLPAPPATKPELASLLAEKATLSTPALPTTLKSVADAADNYKDSVITTTTFEFDPELRNITRGVSAGVEGTEDIVSCTTTNEEPSKVESWSPRKMSIITLTTSNQRVGTKGLKTCLAKSRMVPRGWHQQKGWLNSVFTPNAMTPEDS